MDKLNKKGGEIPFFFFPKNLKTKSHNPLSKDYLKQPNPLSKENLPEHPKEYLLTYHKVI